MTEKIIEPNTLDPLGDGISKISLVDYMGGDLAVVNDARTSFDRRRTELTDRDRKLINYLAKHEHTSPFRSTVFKFRVKSPLFVCRQWYKHTIASSKCEEQFSWNEKSFRYVAIDDPDEFYIPETFRLQSTDNRQATHGALDYEANIVARSIYAAEVKSSYEAYRKLLDLGVGREQARGVLVPAVYTRFVWTVSFQALFHFIQLRLGHGAQSEIAAYAKACLELIKPMVPASYQAWVDKN